MSGRKTRKYIFRTVLLLILLAGGMITYYTFLKPNIYLDGKKYKFIFIPTGSSYGELIEMLEEENILKSRKTFEWLAKASKLEENFKPGKYRVIAGMNNRQLINLIKSGKQEPVKLIFNSLDRTAEDISEKISGKLEISESAVRHFFENDSLLKSKYNLNRETIRCLFIPAAYELKWNTSLPELMEKIQTNYAAFWTNARRQKAKACRLSPAEVIVLASIVQSESSIESEQEKIAGVYLNRLAKNMPLQADPTLLYAIGDFRRQRVLNDDKQINSPYNTYKNKGLPPGPICLPYPQSIDAVLNYARHNFIYFCAKPELNGYSNYSVTYDQHCKYADAYQKEMDKRGINK